MDALLNRGFTRKLLGDFTQASNDYQRVLESDPQNVQAINALANIKVLYGYYSEAIADYTSAINLNDSDASIWFNRGITRILNHSVTEGCNDLSKSKLLGAKQAQEFIDSFCF